MRGWLLDSYAAIQGISFAIVRAYESLNQPDPNGPATVKVCKTDQLCQVRLDPAPRSQAAWAGGMSHVDVYLFPCPTCGNPEGQVSSMVSFLQKNGLVRIFEF